MTLVTSVTQLGLWPEQALPPQKSLKTSHLQECWLASSHRPGFLRDSPTALRLLELLGPLPWAHCPERDLRPRWRFPTIPYGAFIAAGLIKLQEGLRSMGDLHRYLCEHPVLIWLLDFPLYPAPHHPLGFNAHRAAPHSNVAGRAECSPASLVGR